MSKSNKSVNSEVKRGQGRPQAVIKWPAGKFTRTDIFERMEGKCTSLTVQKHLDEIMFHRAVDKKGNPLAFGHVDKTKPRRNAAIMLLPELRAPRSESGLGRKQNVYALRVAVEAHPDWMVPKEPKASKAKTAKTGKPAKVPAKAKAKRTVTVPVVDVKSQTPTADKLDAIHAALAAPVPAPVPAPEPIAEPVAATPEVPATPAVAEPAVS